MSISITTPVANQWKNGGGSSVNFTASGTYVGSPTTIRYRLDTGGGYGAYAVVDAAPTGGNWVGTVSIPASELDYTIEFSFGNDTGTIATVTGIANLYGAISYGGQSNDAGRFTNNQTVRSLLTSGPNKMKTLTGYADLADPTNTEGVSAGSYAIQEVNILSVLLGKRLGVVNFARGATTIANWQKGGGGSGQYEALAAAETLVGGCTICHWGSCESDAHNSTSQSSYHAGIVSLIASRVADFPTCKNIWRTLQPIPAYATQPDQDAINAAILAAAGSTHGLATGDVSGLYLSDVRTVDTDPDGLHWLTDQQAGTVGGLQAEADYKALNIGAAVGGARIFGGF